MTRRTQFLPLDPLFPERLRSNASVWIMNSSDHFSCFWMPDESMVPIVSNESVGRLSALVPVATSLRRAYVRELGANPEDTCRIGFGKGVEQGPQLVGIIGSSFENWVMLTHEIDESQYRRSRIICQAGSIVGAYRVGGGNPHMSPVELQSLSFQLKRTRGCS